MKRLIVSPEAALDFEDVVRHLETEAGAATAFRFVERFRQAYLHLLEFPGTGAPRRQFGETMRLWVVAPYVIYYRFDATDNCVKIVRILHGRRNVSARLLGTP